MAARIETFSKLQNYAGKRGLKRETQHSKLLGKSCRSLPTVKGLRECENMSWKNKGSTCVIIANKCGYVNPSILEGKLVA